MKKLFLASVAALSVLSTAVAYTADESDPPLPRFRPWQQVWQCNDVRVTITGRDPFSVEYDIGGMIWGGSRVVGVRPTGNRDAGKFAADTTQLPTGYQPESLAKSARRRSHKPQRVYRRPREKVGVRRYTERQKKAPGLPGLPVQRRKT